MEHCRCRYIICTVRIGKSCTLFAVFAPCATAFSCNLVALRCETYRTIMFCKQLIIVLLLLGSSKVQTHFYREIAAGYSRKEGCTKSGFRQRSVWSELPTGPPSSRFLSSISACSVIRSSERRTVHMKEPNYVEATNQLF